MTYLVMLLLSASPAGTKYITTHAVASYNMQGVCITNEAIDRSIQIAVEELSKSCTDWTTEKIKSALVGARLYWRSEPWLQASQSCEDAPAKVQVRNADGTVSCPVIGLHYDKRMYVYFGGTWTETLPHEMAHLLQVALDNNHDPHHLGFRDGSCIDTALKSSVQRYNDEMYSKPEYICD